MKTKIILIFLCITGIVYAQPFSLDNSFGTSGIATYTPIFDVYNIALLNDGSILVNGIKYDGVVQNDGTVAKLLPNGMSDPGWTDIMFDSYSGSANEEKTLMIVQPDQKIIVLAMSSFYNTGNPSVILRFNSDGSTDLSYANQPGGFGEEVPGYNYFRSLALTSDGKLLTAGHFYNTTALNEDIVIRKIDANGYSDNSFAGDGTLELAFGSGYDYATTILAQPDGKILVAGYYQNGSDYDPFLMRLNSDGSLDVSFDGDGYVAPHITNNNEAIFDVVLQPDGKIILGGGTNSLNVNFGFEDFLLIRYNPDGSLDNSFDGDGIVISNIDTIDEYITCLELQPDGKILAGGTSLYAGLADNTIVRFNINGSKDLSFGVNGAIEDDTFIGQQDLVADLKIQPDGKILAAIGSIPVSTWDASYGVLRFLNDLNLSVEDLHQTQTLVYPNPVTSSAILKYEMANTEDISIYIMDITGIQVQSVLKNESREKGKHEEMIEFDSHLATGTYFLVVQTLHGSNTIKVQYIK